MTLILLFLTGFQLRAEEQLARPRGADYKPAPMYSTTEKSFNTGDPRPIFPADADDTWYTLETKLTDQTMAPTGKLSRTDPVAIKNGSRDAMVGNVRQIEYFRAPNIAAAKKVACNHAQTGTQYNHVVWHFNCDKNTNYEYTPQDFTGVKGHCQTSQNPKPQFIQGIIIFKGIAPAGGEVVCRSGVSGVGEDCGCDQPATS